MAIDSDTLSASRVLPLLLVSTQRLNLAATNVISGSPEMVHFSRIVQNLYILIKIVIRMHVLLNSTPKKTFYVKRTVSTVAPKMQEIKAMNQLRRKPP